MAICSRITNNFATVWRHDQRHRTLHQCLQVRAHQGFRDEGGRSKRNMDDGNLRLLRERIEVIRIKESLERCFHDYGHAGWNGGGHAPAIIEHYKIQNKVKQSHILELLVTVNYKERSIYSSIQRHCMALVSSPSAFALRLPNQNCRTHPSLQVIRAQRCEDEGRSRNDIVDANMSILMNRIQEVKMKERLERCYETDKLGWNYAKVVVPYQKSKRSIEPFQYIELAGTVGGTFGLTILSGTLGLCLASILLHLNQL
ncbi:hypothetical protein ACH5RR_013873 [Cinchona calisaya]|uniref:Uncharacterized protein n=1 Tax=Cinchona calisaya TaxID=153742 RepID=A0ABD3A1A4_9GENT